MNGSERGGDKGWDLRPAGNAGVTKLPSAIHWARNVTCRAEVMIICRPPRRSELGQAALVCRSS